MLDAVELLLAPALLPVVALLELGHDLLREQLEPEDESARALYRMGRRGMFMGSPAYIRENIRAYEAAHVDVLLFLSQCGDRRHEDIMESLELFAKEVMPEFKERHHRQQRWREEQLDGVQHPIASSV